MILEENIDNLTIDRMKTWLKSMSMTHAYRTRAEYIAQMKKHQNNYNFPWRKDQEEIIKQFTKFTHKYYAIQGVFGAGKCYGLNTPIMMYDGSTKMIQNIEVGDQVMGDDSTPRNVLALGRGQDDMYSITDKKGEKYIVNSVHILCLKYSMKKRMFDEEKKQAWYVTWFDNKNLKKCSKSFNYRNKDKNEVAIEAAKFMDNTKENLNVEIEVKDYIKLPKHLQRTLLGYYTPINFPSKPVPLDPYILGIWLGDGTSTGTRITNQDAAILKYLAHNLGNYNCYLKHISKYDYFIKSTNKSKTESNEVMNALRKLSLINNKHIPDIYKMNDRQTRLMCLAGLIDSDGHFDGHGCFDIIQKNKRLALDIEYLVRSLGFSTKIKECKKSSQNGTEGTYYRLCISGNLDEIPCKVKRKQATSRKQIKDVLVSEIEVKREYHGNYYGFMLDGNRKHVLGNFIVSHNTTMLLGMLLRAFWKKLLDPEDIMFISFNVSIKNEIKQKLRGYGLKSRVCVRTFDSLIWEICKKQNYKYIDLPNFDGKRRFVYNLIEQGVRVNMFQPKCIFIDEVQDLEQQTWKFFTYFYPDATIVFTGDIFQSIQKDPKESLLWYLLHNTSPDVNIKKIYMYQTPRVPSSILSGIKETLTKYYPEFTPEIEKWSSLNTIPASQKCIEWNRFYNYKDLFEKADNHIKEFTPEKTMILTFSSAITVKGAMGDVSRFRTDLLLKGYKLNSNYKIMNEDKLFLSTVNSSKGLERDYVVIFLTFPLERAFINFSQDLTMNLITVGITRAKKKVIFYVPAYRDKFSDCLHWFQECPKPTKESIREGKILQEYTWTDYINMEHCVTELLRQSIILYDTRLAIKENTKPYEWGKMFENPIKVPSTTECEENKSFIGILVENLITSSWLNRWPKLPDLEKIKSNPMYSHCIGKIYKQYERYLKFTQRHKFSEKTQYDGIYIYTQVHIAVFNKLFMNIYAKEDFKKWWHSVKHLFSKPPKENIKIQENTKMPWVTGVIDAFSKGDASNLHELWEIKASKDPNWKDDALSQVLIYALCLGRKRFRIHLINPFRNEKISYYFKSEKILTLRWMIYKDIITWNFNCWLSKNNKGKKPSLKLSNKTIQIHTKAQTTTVQFLSPTKIHIKDFTWKHIDGGKKPDWVTRISMEQTSEQKPTKHFDFSINDIKQLLDEKQEPKTSIDYTKSTTKETPYMKEESDRMRTHSIDWEEGIITTIGWITLLAKQYKIV